MANKTTASKAPKNGLDKIEAEQIRIDGRKIKRAQKCHLLVRLDRQAR
jgi:hypothetical protein